MSKQQIKHLVVVIVVVVVGLVVGFGATIRMFFWSTEGSVDTWQMYVPASTKRMRSIRITRHPGNMNQ